MGYLEWAQFFLSVCGFGIELSENFTMRDKNTNMSVAILSGMLKQTFGWIQFFRRYVVWQKSGCEIASVEYFHIDPKKFKRDSH